MNVNGYPCNPHQEVSESVTGRIYCGRCGGDLLVPDEDSRKPKSYSMHDGWVPTFTLNFEDGYAKAVPDRPVEEWPAVISVAREILHTLIEAKNELECRKAEEARRREAPKIHTQIYGRTGAGFAARRVDL